MKPLLSDDIWVLRQFQQAGYSSAIIGGGAVRDAYLERDPHDIDIFIWDNEKSPETIHQDYRRLDEVNIARMLNMDPNKPKAKIEDEWDQLFGTHTNVNWGDEDEVTRMTHARYQGRGNHINCVWEVYKADFETVYQIIVLNKDPKEYVERYFDIGLCMCYCDGRKMRFTDRFLTDAKNKTLTICGELSKGEYEYTMKHHIQKMKSRFKDYTVVDLLKGTF